MSGQLKQRQPQANQDDEGRSAHYDPLAVLDEHADAEPLDLAEQQAVLAELRAQNDKSNYFYRACMLFLLGLVIVTYLTPIPAYIMGTHPENHLTLFWAQHGTEGSHENLIYLPAGPVYMIFLLFQGLLVIAAMRDTADHMGLINATKSAAFPAQPHRFGTAPDWLVPALNDIRFAAPGGSSKIDQRADGPATEPSGLNAQPPRVVYLGLLLFCSLPMPLMVFGSGNFVNAFWWSLSTAALSILLTVEWSIGVSERQIKGLDGRRYNYKGA